MKSAPAIVLRATSALAENSAQLSAHLSTLVPEAAALRKGGVSGCSVDIALDVAGVDAQTVLHHVQGLYDAATAKHFFRTVNVLPQVNGAQICANHLDTALKYEVHDYVAMGGTFDRLHSGHKMLLTSSILHARTKLRIGITSPELLSKKKYAERVQPYEERVRNVMEFVVKVRSDLEYEIAKLEEASGGTTTIPGVNAMVVSPETFPSFESINKQRCDNGLPPMSPVAIRYVGGDASTRVSSTFLREKDDEM